MPGREDRRARSAWPFAVLPGACVFFVEGSIWALTAATDSKALSQVGTGVLGVGLFAAIVSVLLIIGTERRDALTWAIVSVCISCLGLGGGVVFLFLADVQVCGPRCFD